MEAPPVRIRTVVLYDMHQVDDELLRKISRAQNGELIGVTRAQLDGFKCIQVLVPVLVPESLEKESACP